MSSKTALKPSFVRSKLIDFDNSQNHQQISRSKTEGHLIPDIGYNEVTRPYLQKQANNSTSKPQQRSSSLDLSPASSTRPSFELQSSQKPESRSNDSTTKPTNISNPLSTSFVSPDFDDQRQQLEKIQLKMQQQLQQQQQEINMQMQIERLKQNKPQQQPSSMDELVADFPDLNLKERFDIEGFRTESPNKRSLNLQETDEFNDTDDDYNAFLLQ